MFSLSVSKAIASFFLILLLSFESNLLAGFQAKGDSSSIELRVPDSERLVEISEDSRYKYRETKEELGVWDRFLIWLREWAGDWVQGEYVSLILKITAGIAFLSVLYLLINQISKGELRNALVRRRDRSLLDLNVKTVIENSSKLDELLQNALAKKNYSLAVRYLYQKSILLLKEQGLINWKADKTNHDFLFELGNHPVAIPFDRLTYFHEYVDYGDFKVDEHRYKTIHNVFEEFKTLVYKPE